MTFGTFSGDYPGIYSDLHIDQKVDGNCCETRLKLVQNDEKLKRNISKISFKIALDYSDLHEIWGCLLSMNIWHLNYTQKVPKYDALFFLQTAKEMSKVTRDYPPFYSVVFHLEIIWWGDPMSRLCLHVFALIISHSEQKSFRFHPKNILESLTSYTAKVAWVCFENVPFCFHEDKCSENCIREDFSFLLPFCTSLSPFYVHLHLNCV